MASSKTTRRGAVAPRLAVDIGGTFTDVALGDGGVRTNASKGSLFIDMSTVSPVVSERVAATAEAIGIGYLRAPVNGSVVQAATGGLVILSSGAKDGFKTAEPLFEIMGDRIFYIGPGEQARYLKLSINIMIGITASMTGEALACGEAGGLDWADMIDIIASSAIGSPAMTYFSRDQVDVGSVAARDGVDNYC